MILIKIIFFVIIWTLLSIFYKYIKTSFMNKKCGFFYKIKTTIRSIYRLVNSSKTADYVWVELTNYYKNSGLKYGQYDYRKQVICDFIFNESRTVKFEFNVETSTLSYSSIILPSFDEERTNAILILASHFNNLLNFGIVKVCLKYNYISFEYSRDVLIYSLYPGEIDFDTRKHFGITKDIIWAFDSLLETGDDPVFIFSELLKRRAIENERE